jgi:hypothetical protein
VRSLKKSSKILRIARQMVFGNISLNPECIMNVKQLFDAVAYDGVWMCLVVYSGHYTATDSIDVVYLYFERSF